MQLKHPKETKKQTHAKSVEDLATEAMSQEPIKFLFKGIHHSVGIKNVHTFEGVSIAISPREFSKNVIKLKNVKKLQALERFKGTAINHMSTNKHWNNWSQLWVKKKETSFKQSRRMARWLKLITNELLTVEVLHKRRPDLYSKQTKCQWCKAEETLDHLIACVSNPNRKEWKEYLIKKFCKLKNRLGWEQQKTKNLTDCIWQMLEETESSINIRISVLPILVHLLLTEMTKRSKINLAVQLSVRILIKSIWKWVWVPSCKIFREWEKSVGITFNQKNTYCVGIKKALVKWKDELRGWIKNGNLY